MKKSSLFLGLTLALTLFSQPALAGSHETESMVRAMNENYGRQVLENGLAAGQPGEAPRNTFIFVPSFTYTHNGQLNDLGLPGLLSDSGNSRSAGFALVGKRLVSDTITLTLKYEYTYTSFDGSSMHPAASNTPGGAMSFSSYTKQDVNSHAILAAIEKNFGPWGKLSFAFIQSFSNYSGHENMNVSMGGNPLPTDSRAVVTDGRVSVFGVTYIKPFELSPAFTLSPYLGGSISYVALDKLNDFSVPYAKHMDNNAWGHDIYGGLMLDYRAGLWSASLRGGVSHLLDSKPIGGFMVRSTAPEVNMAGFNVGGDKTVGTFGASLNYFIPQTALLSLSYNGMAGSSVQGHNVTFAIIVPF